MFFSQTYAMLAVRISFCILSQFFPTLPVGFDFIFLLSSSIYMPHVPRGMKRTASYLNRLYMAYGLKPQLGGITVSTVYSRSIFQVEWLTLTLILL